MCIQIYTWNKYITSHRSIIPCVHDIDVYRHSWISLLEHLHSPSPILCGVRVDRSVVFCVVSYIPIYEIETMLNWQTISCRNSSKTYKKKNPSFDEYENVRIFVLIRWLCTIWSKNGDYSRYWVNDVNILDIE